MWTVCDRVPPLTRKGFCIFFFWVAITTYQLPVHFVGNFLYGEWLVFLVTSSNSFLLPIATALGLSGLSFNRLELIQQWRCHSQLVFWEPGRKSRERREQERRTISLMSKPGTLGSSSLLSVLLLHWLTTFFILLCLRYNHHSVNPKSEWHLPEISVLLSTGFGCNNFASFRKSLMNWDLETQRYNTLLFPPSVAKYIFTHHLLCARCKAAWWEIFFKKSTFQFQRVNSAPSWHHHGIEWQMFLSILWVRIAYV